VNEDDDSDDSSAQYRPQRRVPALNSSSQENSSLVVRGNDLKYLFVIGGLSLLLALALAPKVFLRVLQFSSLHKNQHF